MFSKLNCAQIFPPPRATQPASERISGFQKLKFHPCRRSLYTNITIISVISIIIIINDVLAGSRHKRLRPVHGHPSCCSQVPSRVKYYRLYCTRDCYSTVTSILVDCPTQQYLYLDFHLLCSMTKVKEHNREICCLNPVSAVSMWLMLRMMTLTTVAERIANCHPGDQFLTWPTRPLSKPRLLTTGSQNITLEMYIYFLSCLHQPCPRPHHH